MVAEENTKTQRHKGTKAPVVLPTHRSRPSPSCYSSISTAMKVVCTVVSFVMFLHLQCGGTCLVQVFSGAMHPVTTTTEPPCHQHGKTPGHDQAPSPDKGGPCSQGQIV